VLTGFTQQLLYRLVEIRAGGKARILRVYNTIDTVPT
jgi:hypothetical protein